MLDKIWDQHVIARISDDTACCTSIGISFMISAGHVTCWISRAAASRFTVLS